VEPTCLNCGFNTIGRLPASTDFTIKKRHVNNLLRQVVFSLMEEIMVRVVLLLSVLLVGVVSYYLLKKNKIFLPLLKEGEIAENKDFFVQFGKMYFLMALIGLLVTVLDQPFYSFGYIFLLFVLSGIFSLIFAKKMR
jgi:flagellar biosynthesis protein FlhB